MIQTKADYIAAPIPLLSRPLSTVMRPCQWLAAAVIRLVLVAVPHRVEIRLEPGDLKPGFCYVIAANHQSRIDPFVICSLLPVALWRRLRPFRFFTYNALFNLGLLRPALLALGCFPASPHARYAYGIEAARNFLAHGQTVFIFPQGKRTASKGNARSGVSILYQAPNVMVIPARLEWRRHGRWRRSFALVVGRPLLERGLSAEQILDQVYCLSV